MASSLKTLNRDSLDSFGRLYWSRVYYEGYLHASTCDYLMTYGLTEAQVCRIVQFAQMKAADWSRDYESLEGVA